MTGPPLESRTACPACGSTRFGTRYSAPYDEPPMREYLEGYYTKPDRREFDCLRGASYILCECEVCGLIFQRDIPDDRLMETLYERWICPVESLKHSVNGLSQYSHHAQEVMQLIAYFGRTSPPLAFLDYGMGWGDWALMAKAFGCDSYGTELSVARADHARANGINVISGEDIPHRRFDFINTEQVFEHIPRPLETLSYLAGSLSEGGLLRISIPSAKGIERRLKRMDWTAPRKSKDSLLPVAPLEHINCFRRPTLVTMAALAGMEEVVLPAKVQFGHRTDWGGPVSLAKNLVRPVYRGLLRRDDCIFLRNVQPQ